MTMPVSDKYAKEKGCIAPPNTLFPSRYCQIDLLVNLLTNRIRVHVAGKILTVFGVDPRARCDRRTVRDDVQGGDDISKLATRRSVLYLLYDLPSLGSGGVRLAASTSSSADRRRPESNLSLRFAEPAGSMREAKDTCACVARTEPA
jgi:hypothetical protein